MIDPSGYRKLEMVVRRDFAMAAIEAGHDRRTALVASRCYVQWSHLRVDGRRDRSV